MAESFSDEELAEAGLNDPAIRLGATIARLQRERDTLAQRVNDLKGEIENMDEENVYLMRGRDEARRVAKVLAGYVADYAPLMVEADLASATKTALAYPEAKP